MKKSSIFLIYCLLLLFGCNKKPDKRQASNSPSPQIEIKKGAGSVAKKETLGDADNGGSRERDEGYQVQLPEDLGQGSEQQQIEVEIKEGLPEENIEQTAIEEVFEEPVVPYPFIPIDISNSLLKRLVDYQEFYKTQDYYENICISLQDKKTLDDNAEMVANTVDMIKRAMHEMLQPLVEKFGLHLPEFRFRVTYPGQKSNPFSYCEVYKQLFGLSIKFFEYDASLGIRHPKNRAGVYRDTRHMVLPMSGETYGVILHEMGHIMGFNDVYLEDPEENTFEGCRSGFEKSLMCDGQILTEIEKYSIAKAYCYLNPSHKKCDAYVEKGWGEVLNLNINLFSEGALFNCVDHEKKIFVELSESFVDFDAFMRGLDLRPNFNLLMTRNIPTELELDVEGVYQYSLGKFPDRSSFVYLDKSAYTTIYKRIELESDDKKSDDSKTSSPQSEEFDSWRIQATSKNSTVNIKKFDFDPDLAILKLDLDLVESSLVVESLRVNFSIKNNGSSTSQCKVNQMIRSLLPEKDQALIDFQDL